MSEWLTQPWPWYVTGSLIGLMVPMLLLLRGKAFGISSSLQHICAAVLPGRHAYFDYNWREKGLWNLIFAGGVLAGGFLAGMLIPTDAPLTLSEATITDLSALGISNFNGLVPVEFFSWSALTSPTALILIVFGGFLVGFGTRYAGGCTSGHAIMGLSMLQKPSLYATIAFFIGGLVVTHFILPLII